MHDSSHEPIRDHAECFTCNSILRRAFNDLAGLDLGPRDADVLMNRIREIAAGYMAQGAAW